VDASDTSSAVLAERSAKAAAVSRGRLPLALCVSFLVSGSSGLMYEVVWLRMLSRTLGSTVYATSTILAVFMGGLALGSFIFGRIADRVRRPLLLYAGLEAAIGASALLSLGLNLWPIPLYRAIYSLAGESRAILSLGQIAVAGAALLIPTTLMGATLPTLSAYGVRRFSLVGHVVGALYALNTLGAAAGVWVSGFVLIGAIGETRTVLVGAAINGLVAIAAFLLLPRNSKDAGKPREAIADPVIARDILMSRRARRTILGVFAVSGFVSLALEIAWSRMLALYEGTSIYAFSSMLGVMLVGIGLGGWFGRRVERWKDPLLALGRLELGIGLAAAYSLAIFGFIGVDYGSLFLPPLIMVAPVALLMGVAFPVAVRCYSDCAGMIGRRVGELYAWNTIGCIFGSLAGGFVLVPEFGAARTGALLAGFSLVAYVALICVHPRGLRTAGIVDVSGFVVTVIILAMVGDPYRDLIYSHLAKTTVFAHVEEAAASTTAAGNPREPLVRELLVNGYGMTGLITGNKLMADLPLWMADSPHDALVICMGMGTTFRSAARHRDIDVTVVELVPAVTRFMHFYHPDADQIMAQSNAHVVVNDGRNYLLMNQRKVDVITIDPAPPLYSAGTVNLYSREFVRLCADRIRPGGAVCLWIPPGQMSEVKMIMRTFALEFPYVTAWAGPTFRGFFLVGMLRPVTNVADRVRRGFADQVTVADLTEWDRSCATPEDVLGLWICDRDALLAYTANQSVVTDDRPYTEFPLWRLRGSDPEYARMLDADVLKNALAGSK
jgi:spermidine synthase